MKMLLGAHSGEYVGISIRASEGCSGSIGSSLHCSYSSPSLWNSLPCNLRQAESLNELSNYIIPTLDKLRHGIHGKQVKFSLGFNV